MSETSVANTRDSSPRGNRRSLERSEFEGWVREHHRAVYASALRILGQAEEALDVTQKVYLELLEKGVDVAPDGDPRRLLSWMATQHALSQLRSAANRRRREDETAMRQPTSFEDQGPEIDEERGVIARFVSKLPEDLRLAVVLRFQEGLSFREVGQALACSEPTAHDRVKRGLERLRIDLGRSGLGAWIAGLPERLQRSETPRVPPGLEGELLALQGASLATGWGVVSSTSLLVALIGTAGLLGLWLFDALGDDPNSGGAPSALGVLESPQEGSPGGDDSPTSVSERAVAASPRTAPVRSSSGTSSAPESTPLADQAFAQGFLEGFVEGRVIDFEGNPIEGALVRAESLERRGKPARFKAEGLTLINGHFRFEVPVANAGGQRYRLYVLGGEYVRADVSAFTVPAQASAPFAEITLIRQAEDRPGSYELTVVLVNEDGDPVPDAQVSLFRKVRSPAGAWYPQWKPSGARETSQLEVQTRSDAFGRASLAGDRLGDKELTIVPHGNLQRVRHKIALQVEGQSELRFVLQPGLVIGGRVLDVEDQPQEGFYVKLLGQTSEQKHSTSVAADGRFLLVGLSPGAHRVEVGGARQWTSDGTKNWSPISLEGVAAGREDLELRLKLAEDTRDHGHHDAEIHGRLIDAASGETLEIDGYSISAQRVPDELDDEQVRRDLFPIYVRPFMGQRMANPRRTPGFHKTGLAPGRYVIVAHWGQYSVGLAGPLHLERGQLLDDVVIPMSDGARIEGVVRDPSGRPVEGAFVLLTGEGPRSEEQIQGYSELVRESQGEDYVLRGHTARSDASGRFVFQKVSPKLHLRLAAMHSDFASGVSPPLELFDGETTGELTVQLGARVR